jgi:hypothetical protein
MTFRTALDQDGLDLPGEIHGRIRSLDLEQAGRDTASKGEHNGKDPSPQ